MYLRGISELNRSCISELTCFSKEGIADMELPDNLLDELEILENITSCNKVGMSCIIGSQSRKAAFFRILLGDIYKW